MFNYLKLFYCNVLFVKRRYFDKIGIKGFESFIIVVGKSNFKLIE